MSKPKPTNADDYLELFKISEYKYIIGIFESGITFYKQQIRALNIFDALKKTEKIPDRGDFTIAIVGGGIAGLTFAAASLKSGFNVILFEKGSQTLNIQAGCTTRDIHPYLYDWPGDFSTQTRTNLPVLNWHHDSASNVVKSIKDEFAKIVADADAIHRDSYEEYFSVKELKINECTSGKRFEILGKTESRYPGENIHQYADLIIYAVGYGVEKGVSVENKSESYWRDTSIKQDDLSNSNYIIQGTGDGALIDLFNILIRDFSYDTFLEILRGDEAGKRLLQRLIGIRNERLKGGKLRDDFYRVEFAKIPKSEIQYIFDAYDKKKLFAKLDASVNVYLFGKKKEFYEILHYNRISLINAFIANILFRYQKFLYGSGLRVKAPEYDGKLIAKNRKLIRRIGTDSKAVIANVGFSPKEKKQITTITKRQHKSALHGIVRPNWDDDAFNKYFGDKRQLHHLSKKTKSLCSVFVDILGSSLEDFYQGRDKNTYKEKKVDNKVLRATIHRVLSIDGKLNYQMLTPYAPIFDGALREDFKVGTIYNIDKGNVGFSIKTGLPLWVKNESQEEFDKLMKDLNIFNKRYDKKYSPKTILTIPIIAPFEGEYSNKVKTFKSTNAVIYIDSSEKDFFDDPDVQNLIIRFCETFVNTLNVSFGNDDITMATVDFLPPKIHPTELTNSCVVDLKSLDATKKHPIARLNISKFKIKLTRYCSFEMLPWN